MRVYFMGICGVAMGNAAIMLQGQGHEVCGADSGVYPPMAGTLQKAGIRCFEGYDPNRLESFAPDLVVIGNVLSRGNPEVEWLLQTRKYPYTSLPAFIGDTLLKSRKNIVVTGTHGKTTTAALTAALLRNCGKNPGYFIGGLPLDLPGGATCGDSADPFVIEGDEYDSAFFDKRSKFIHYHPNILTINNLEFDHGDIFRDLQDVQRTFNHLLRLVPGNGYILANGDDPNLKELLPVPWTQTIFAGEGRGNDLQILDYSANAEGSSFSLEWRGRPWGRVTWSLHGYFNARNAALAALSVALTLYPEDITRLPLDLLKNMKGVKRRQEILLESEGFVLLEDFGHHPTAIELTLESLRARYPGCQLAACFEARSNTARSPVFQEDFCNALARADNVFLGPVHRSEKLMPGLILDTEKLSKNLREKGVDASAFDSNVRLLEAAHNLCIQVERKKLILCFFSNGSFDGVMESLANRLQKVQST